MEKTYSKECSIIAYYFSKFDNRAVDELGFKNQKEAFDKLTALFGKKPNFIKLRRDEFDAIVSSVRKGWWKRLPTPGNWELHCELKMLSFEELTEKVKDLIENKRAADEKEKQPASATGKKRIKITTQEYHEVRVKKKY